jgi:hypothetical protein
MNQKITVALLGILIVSGCAASAWWSKKYTDGHILARVIYDEATKLADGLSRKEDFVPLLRNADTIFTETDGTAVTVRDAAFTILAEADEAEMPVNWAKVKFIYSCTVNDVLYRVHIPVLSDNDFAQVIRVIQQPSPPDRR